LFTYRLRQVSKIFTTKSQNKNQRFFRTYFYKRTILCLNFRFLRNAPDYSIHNKTENVLVTLLDDNTIENKSKDFNNCSQNIQKTKTLEPQSNTLHGLKKKPGRIYELRKAWQNFNFTFYCFSLQFSRFNAPIMIPLNEINEIECTYQDLTAEEWAGQAAELEKELNLYKYMSRM